MKLCDFGLARTLPAETKIDKAIKGCKSRREIAEELKVSRKERQKRKRELSNHVVSRWYRAPEVILAETSYDQAIDIWAGGCILSEMISMSDHYSSMITPEDRFIFTGTSCFPLSPCDKMKKAKDNSKAIVSKNDQLRVILQILGYQTDEDASFISGRSSQDYLTTLQSTETKINFTLEYPKTHERLCNTLDSMLQFNPYFRGTASDLLKNKIFDNIRDPKMEEPAPFKIVLEYDEANCFDYSECKSKTHDLEDLKRIFRQEIELI